jgi:hypothetical protein
MSVDAEKGRASRPVLRVVASVLAEVRAAQRYQDRSTIDDAGRHHAKGGFWNDRAKGGFWNDRDGRAAHGIAKVDAATLRRELRAIGELVTLDEADALLLAAEMDALRPTGRTPEQERAKKQRRRSRRQPGVCQVCTTNPVKPGTHRRHGIEVYYRTCPECIARAAAAKSA